jgi:hypothetical protein
MAPTYPGRLLHSRVCLWRSWRWRTSKAPRERDPRRTSSELVPASPPAATSRCQSSHQLLWSLMPIPSLRFAGTRSRKGLQNQSAHHQKMQQGHIPKVKCNLKFSDKTKPRSTKSRTALNQPKLQQACTGACFISSSSLPCRRVAACRAQGRWGSREWWR